MNILISLLIALVIVAIFILILYLFEKYVQIIDAKVRGILIFVVAVLLIIYVLTGHSLAFWN